MTRPRITAVTTVRNEPDWFVAQLVDNLAWCDEVLVLTVPPDGPWLHEGDQNAWKRELLYEVGAEWSLWLDPDERLEDSAADLVPRFAQAYRYRPEVVFGFPLREMWTPDAYRVDGVWTNKLPRRRLFRLEGRGRQVFNDRPIHSSPAPAGSKRYSVTIEGVNLYHLKSIEQGNRAERGKAYRDVDPDWRYQKPIVDGEPSWEWLVREDGLQLELIPDGRGFTPAYDRPYEFRAPS